MKIIETNNIQEISKLYPECTNAIIFGKGPTFQIITEKQPTQFFVCINETINFINNCDLLVCNDLETFDKINNFENLANVKNILVPYHIHHKCHAHDNITYQKVIDKIKAHFDGNLIVYNLKSINKVYPNYIKLQSTFTSSHTGFEFIGVYLKQIKHVDLYGVMISGNYHTLFTPTTNISIHNEKRGEAINCIKELSKKHNLTFKLN